MPRKGITKSLWSWLVCLAAMPRKIEETNKAIHDTKKEITGRIDRLESQMLREVERVNDDLQRTKEAVVWEDTCDKCSKGIHGKLDLIITLSKERGNGRAPEKGEEPC